MSQNPCEECSCSDYCARDGEEPCLHRMEWDRAEKAEARIAALEAELAALKAAMPPGMWMKVSDRDCELIRRDLHIEGTEEDFNRICGIITIPAPTSPEKPENSNSSEVVNG